MDLDHFYDLGVPDCDGTATDSVELPVAQTQQARLVFLLPTISALGAGGSSLKGTAAARVSPLQDLAKSYASACGLSIVDTVILQGCIRFALVPAPRGRTLPPTAAHDVLVAMSGAICKYGPTAILHDCVPSLSFDPLDGATECAEDAANRAVVACAIGLLRWCSQYGVPLADAAGNGIPLPSAKRFPGLPHEKRRIRLTFCPTHILQNGDLLDERQRYILPASHPLAGPLALATETGSAFATGDFADGGSCVYRRLDPVPRSAFEIWQSGKLTFAACPVGPGDPQMSFDC